MARIEGVHLPRNKRVEVGLNYLFGIGPTRSREILVATKINPDTRVKDLTETEVSAIHEYIREELESRRRPAPPGTAEYQAFG